MDPFATKAQNQQQICSCSEGICLKFRSSRQSQAHNVAASMMNAEHIAPEQGKMKLPYRSGFRSDAEDAASKPGVETATNLAS
jgi:hypothetical protein